VTDSNDWGEFIGLLNGVLEKHGAVAVHTPQELELLSSLFPENISLRIVKSEGKLLAATLLFKFGTVVHTQYLATNSEGKEVGALDYLIEACIQESLDSGFKYLVSGCLLRMVENTSTQVCLLKKKVSVPVVWQLIFMRLN